MKCFQNNHDLYFEIRDRLIAHQEADEIVQGRYWEKGKGCAVGCTIHGSTHSDYEKLFQIPTALAYLEEHIFEKSTSARAKSWPLEFWNAIVPGSDLSLVVPKFLVWLLTDPKHGAIQYGKKEAIQNVANLWAEVVKGRSVESLKCDFSAAAAASAAAARTARTAAADAYAAYAAAARTAAAANASAYADAAAARTAAAAATAAARTAAAAYADAVDAAAAYADAARTAVEIQRRKLIALLSEASAMEDRTMQPIGGKPQKTVVTKALAGKPRV